MLHECQLLQYIMNQLLITFKFTIWVNQHHWEAFTACVIQAYKVDLETQNCMMPILRKQYILVHSFYLLYNDIIGTVELLKLKFDMTFITAQISISIILQDTLQWTKLLMELSTCGETGMNQCIFLIILSFGTLIYKTIPYMQLMQILHSIIQYLFMQLHG